MQKYIRMKGFVWQKQVFGKGRQDNVQIIKFINKKSRNKSDFSLLVKLYFSIFEKRRYETN